jgi:HNH endonuclease
MDESLRELVWERAGDACEYCRLPQRFDILPFQIDHVIALKHHGPTTAANLALCCYNDNAHKGPNIAGIDPATGAVTRLFHPRRDDWNEHFTWVGPELAGRTPIGRTTIDVLNINLPERVEHRRLLIQAGLLRLERT